jgi:hypothetical protein
MLLEKIVNLAQERGWKQQACGATGTSGSWGTNFYKDGKVLSVSIVEEGHMVYPDKDELAEMFGRGQLRASNKKGTEVDKNGKNK